jgi:branched-chain amino acid transport system permease protein
VGFTAGLPRGPILLGLVWFCLVPSVLAYAAFFKGSMGENAWLLREAPLEAATLGIDGGLWRFLAFVAGGAYAGLAGGFSAALSGVVSPEVTGFPVMLLCLTSVVVGGVRHPMGAVSGRGRRRLPARAVPRAAGQLAAGLCRRDAGRRAVGAQRAGWPARQAQAAPAADDAWPHRPGAGPQRLVLDRISKRFGGVDALVDVSFTLDRARSSG